MTEPEFTITCVATDRTRPLATGEVAVRGARLRFVFDETESIFRTALNEARFPLRSCPIRATSVSAARRRRWANYVAGCPCPVVACLPPLADAYSRAVRLPASFAADLKGAESALTGEYQHRPPRCGCCGMMNDARRPRRPIVTRGIVGGSTAPAREADRPWPAAGPSAPTSLCGEETLDAMLSRGTSTQSCPRAFPRAVLRGEPRIRRPYSGPA